MVGVLEVGMHVGLVVAAISDHVINYPKKVTTRTKRSCQLTQKMGHSILFSSFMQRGRHFDGSKMQLGRHFHGSKAIAAAADSPK